MTIRPSLLEHSNSHTLSAPHKYSVIFDIFNVLFSYKSLPFPEALMHMYHMLGGRKNLYKPIPAGIEILTACYQTLKKNSSNKNLFILSNIGTQGLSVMTSSYPEVFSLVDGIITSGTTGFKKPDPRIYQYLLDKYHLTPEYCIFIDDMQANVTAAQSVGMKGIICNNHASVAVALKEYGLL